MVKELMVGDVMQEFAGTRCILESIPEEHLTWKPHERSMSLGELATHIVNLFIWQEAILRCPEFDLAAAPPSRAALESRKVILEEFDTRAGELSKLLTDSDEEYLREDWTLRHGEMIIHRQPRALALRTFGISHMIHHRAQLGVYLRLLDIPVPGLYGPSADDKQQKTPDFI
ncbi:DinB family protein [Paenibacillus sp. N3/727]|uniref:DinB family protein n=1 Tax=Paenibacillus sp. N3/727 TaxID=2925845 RepID=UPI001F52C61F|nr:DinB family protein [Paenibacillus sp. N3/727]UNK17895.1 DinB family protein [Paenibacillus sp. N3/727]